MFAVICNPNRQQPQTKIFISSHSCNFAQSEFLQKNLKTLEQPLHPSSSNHDLGLFASIIHHLFCSLSSVFSRSISMANRKLDVVRHSWAKKGSSSIILRHSLQLFQACTINTSLHFELLQNQVSFRIPSFALLCYVFKKSFHACSNATWVMLIG